MENAGSDQDYDLLKPQWDTLMFIRRRFFDSGQDLAGIDANIAKLFDPNAYSAIEQRLRKVEQLSNMGGKTEEMGIATAAIGFAIANVFTPKTEDNFEQDVAKWEQLVEMRGQMKLIGVGTEDIDKLISTVFKPPLAVREPSAPPGLFNDDRRDREDSTSCRQITSDTQVEKAVEIFKPTSKPKKPMSAKERRPISMLDTQNLRRSVRRQQAEAETHAQADSVISTVSRRVVPAKRALALQPKVRPPKRVKKAKPDFWSNLPDNSFFIRFHSINAGGLFCKPSEEIKTLGFYPDAGTRMLVIRGLRPSQSTVTFNYLGLQWVPKSITHAIRVEYDTRARVVSIDEGRNENFADVEFFAVEQLKLLLMHLQEVSDVVVEFVGKEQLDEMFAANVPKFRLKRSPHGTPSS